MRKLSLFLVSVMLVLSFSFGLTGMKSVNAAGSNFVDVASNAYYYNAVNWAVEKGITKGTGNKFNPIADCKRQDVVTFMWRAAGSPEPKATANFSDVPASTYYTKAVAWAAEKGITTGTGGGKFNPNGICTREQFVTFLWRSVGSPTPTKMSNFRDVDNSAYYAKAVAWAAENGITTGVTPTKFDTGKNCQRGQVVTFLHRYENPDATNTTTATNAKPHGDVCRCAECGSYEKVWVIDVPEEVWYDNVRVGNRYYCNNCKGEWATEAEAKQHIKDSQAACCAYDKAHNVDVVKFQIMATDENGVCNANEAGRLITEAYPDRPYSCSAYMTGPKYEKVPKVIEAIGHWETKWVPKK